MPCESTMGTTCYILGYALVEPVITQWNDGTSYQGSCIPMWKWFHNTQIIDTFVGCYGKNCTFTESEST
jgi:hypothetical protein